MNQRWFAGFIARQIEKGARLDDAGQELEFLPTSPGDCYYKFICRGGIRLIYGTDTATVLADKVGSAKLRILPVFRVYDRRPRVQCTEMPGCYPSLITPLDHPARRMDNFQPIQSI